MPATRRSSDNSTGTGAGTGATASRGGSAPYVQQKLSFTQSKPGASAKPKKAALKTPTPPPAPKAVDFTVEEDASSSEGEESEIEAVKTPKPPTPVKRAQLDAKDRAGKYKGYWAEAQRRMGYQAPIHGKDESKVQRLLRVFDLSYEYGPCIGMSRLERWERAQAMGLDPPAEVREILITEQGAKEQQLAQCIYFETDA